ncbi:MAG: hypothetical protein K5668_11425 [Lachnospiraceae bacterium]|nr:hypothetical protein [Lachnospiraceae bacterium]
MQYCPKCRVNIHGKKKACPLCQKKLEYKDFDDSSFPVFPERKISSVTFMKILTFILAAFCILTWMVSFMVPEADAVIRICQIVAFFIWVDVFIVNYLRFNLIKTITIETLIVMTAVLIADILTGWHRWSVTWVVPSILFALMIATLIISKAARLHADEFISYLMLDSAVALIQLIFIRLGLNWFPYPAIISVTLYLLLDAGVVIFGFGDLMTAIARRLNL